MKMILKSPFAVVAIASTTGMVPSAANAGVPFPHRDAGDCHFELKSYKVDIQNDRKDLPWDDKEM